MEVANRCSHNWRADPKATLLRLQQEEEAEREAESTEPLPHPYEGELKDLEWLLDNDLLQQGVYAAPAAAIAPAASEEEPLLLKSVAGVVCPRCVSCSADFFSMKEPPVAPPTEETPLVIVETPRQLREMLDELCSGRHRVVALDTEHHSYESYKGFVCLLQLSTCTSAGAPKDFLVDPFSLFYELTQLNRLTADPKILKVMHGATSDVLWLQASGKRFSETVPLCAFASLPRAAFLRAPSVWLRSAHFVSCLRPSVTPYQAQAGRDFSVYFVNVFDTAVAARTLTIPGGASLANLLSFYLKKRKDTKMQLADWRIRPLSDEMKNYGRSDTHYLPYLYQCMQNQLLSRDDETGIYTLRCTTPHDLGTPTASGRAAVLGVLQRSRNICLSLYTEGPFDAEAEAAQMLRRNNTALAPLSVAVLKGLLAWRDSVARKRDVSPHAVLPNACVLLLAQRRPLEHVHLRHAIRPTPAAIHRYGPEILKAIQTALERATAPPAPAKSQETLQPIKQQRSQEEDQAGEDDAAELLPSAEVLRGAAADQEGLLDAETVPASAPSLQDTLVGDKDSQRFFKGLEDVSNGSSNESNTPGSSSDKACQPQQLPVRVGGFFSGGAEALKSPVVIRISSAVLSHRMQDVEFRIAVGAAASPSFADAYIPTRMARQVARWVYSQLQQMERDQLLHSRSKRRRDELLQAPAEQPQTGRTTSSEFLLLPAYPPPPPPPEAVPTAAAAAVASGLTSVDAATTSVATAAGPVDSAVRPTNGEKETPNDTEGKCPLSGGPDLALGLVTIAQQKWKRRKRQRTRTATAAAAPAVLAQNPTPGF
ncbi:exosome component [Cyclospora cayetanensis]|uniref:Exosome component n=1 Tax=Cyclospora cayetanensis TaxID=88456 RepID=A0A1D3D8U6_9EIME|nr:exosome component [Cyclospora cayetanensis]